MAVLSARGGFSVGERVSCVGKMLDVWGKGQVLCG